MIEVKKLPLEFDAAALRVDAEGFAQEEWIAHFNTQQYVGDWSGVVLRAPKNAHLPMYPDPTAEEFEDTPSLEKCPGVRGVMEKFECKLESVRFLRLGAGAKITEHRDYMLAIEEGVARIHIPVVTNDQVDFILNGRKVEMGEGEAWYLNFNLKHSVTNRGSGTRIHLVIDCIANGWLEEMVKSPAR